jgi:predicted nucleic acid-binding protein
MFLLDTNVISELRRARRTDPNVAAWAENVTQDVMFLSSVTILELEIGALRLARRDAGQGPRIQRWIENRVLPAFANHVLPVDTEVARRCARLHIPDPRPYRDSLIAATALVHGLTVATRNRADFEPMAVPMLNPWDAPRS